MDVDCGCKYTRPIVHQPRPSKAADGQIKVTSGKKMTYTGTVGTGAAHEAANGEVTYIISQIKQHHRDGSVWWHYCYDDENDKNGGLRLDENTLPSAEFRLLPKSPDPIPPAMNISVGSFWSLESLNKANSILPKLFHRQNSSGLPRHMNLYGRILLEIPSCLAADSDYMDTTRVHPEIFNRTVELCGDVHVESLVAHVKSIQDGDIPQGQSPAEDSRD